MRTKKKNNVLDHASSFADRLTPAVDAAREKAGPMLSDAREKAAPLIADAREKAAPLIADAREKATPVVEGARDRFTAEVLPTVTAALAAASEATEDVRDETRKRSKAALAALKGEVEPPKKSHKLRNLLMMLGLGGIAAVAAKLLSNREATTAWQSSYTPPPSPVTPSAPQSGAHKAEADDEGGAAPDVAIADSSAEPHAATTPDNPATQVDLTKE
jgi:vacuolar-type H+-ATPase subunit H